MGAYVLIAVECGRLCLLLLLLLSLLLHEYIGLEALLEASAKGKRFHK